MYYQYNSTNYCDNTKLLLSGYMKVMGVGGVLWDHMVHA
jgi:hypothetical protein